MSIRLTGLSMLVGTLFIMSAATAAAIPSEVAIATQQGEAAALVLAQSQNREGKGKGKGKGEEEGKECANQSDDGDHGQEKREEKKEKKEKNKDKDKEKANHDSYTHNIAIQAEALSLSDEQLGKIVRLHLKEDHEAHDLLKKNMKKSMKAFRKAVTQPTIDEATLRKLGQEHIDSFNEMINYHVEERKAIISILTPEQVEKLKEIKTEKNKQEHEHEH